MPNPHSLSPAACLELLSLFEQRLLGLSTSEFDRYFDVVLAVLESANNERYRLRDDSEEA